MTQKSHSVKSAVKCQAMAVRWHRNRTQNGTNRQSNGSQSTSNVSQTAANGSQMAQKSHSEWRQSAVKWQSIDSQMSGKRQMAVRWHRNRTQNAANRQSNVSSNRQSNRTQSIDAVGSQSAANGSQMAQKSHLEWHQSAVKWQSMDSQSAENGSQMAQKSHQALTLKVKVSPLPSAWVSAKLALPKPLSSNSLKLTSPPSTANTTSQPAPFALSAHVPQA